MSLQAVLTKLEYEQDITNDYLYTVVVSNLTCYSRNGLINLEIFKAVVMNSLNKPEDIQPWFNILLDRINRLECNSKDAIIAQMVSKLREAILKSYVIVGFPKVKRNKTE